MKTETHCVGEKGMEETLFLPGIKTQQASMHTWHTQGVEVAQSGS